MDFSFVLPRQNKDLLDGGGNNFFVKQTYSASEIPNHFRAANQALQNGDAFYIFDHFDTFFSVIENAQQMQMQQLLRAMDQLYRTTEKLGQMLDTYLNRDNLDNQINYLNLIKMVIYLLVSTVRAIDVFVKNQAKSAIPTGRKNKKATDEDGPHLAAWETKRFDVLIQLSNIMNLPIEKLWPNAIVEEDFVTLLCDLGYRTLTHPSIKERRIIEAAFQIFGLAIKQYNQPMVFSVRIVQILESEEVSVVPVARGIQFLQESFGITTVLAIIMKELIEKLNVPNPSAATAKHVSMFLTEITEISSDMSVEVLQNNSPELLDLEPYSIRNSVFVMMGRVITEHLSAEGLNEDQKEFRDDLLRDLLNHLEDVNSYSRSKVLQIWNELKTQNAVPLKWHLEILGTVIQRLEDKTATVRKNAITLLKSFLETNPFASKLTLEELEAKYNDELKALDAITVKIREQDELREATQADFQERCVNGLQPYLTDILSGNGSTTNNVNGEQPLPEDQEERITLIRRLLNDGKWEELAHFIVRLDAGVSGIEERPEMGMGEKVLYYICLVGTYLFDNFESEKEAKENTAGFLLDSINFSKMIIDAVPKLEELLMSKTNSDVIEAIDFFKTGYLFNIRGTEIGMRSMLRLLWTTDKEKRDAVIKAYHSVLFQTDSSGRAHSIKVVDNLYKFITTISTGEYQAFELMIKEWIESGEIDVNIIGVMFERFTLKMPDTSLAVSRCCMELLILASNAKPSIAASNKELIVNIGCGTRILQDPRLFAGCLQLLMNTIVPDSKYYQRWDDKNETFVKVLDLYKRFFFYPKLPSFELITLRVISFIYRFVQAPDIVCQEMIQTLCSKLMELSDKRKAKQMDMSENGVESSQKTEMYISPYLLPRIIFLYGLVASKELVYLDVDIYNNMKHREDLKREKKDQKKGDKHNKSVSNKSVTQRNTSMNASASEALKRLSTVTSDKTTNDQDEEELGLLGATAEDGMAELIHDACEKGLVNDPNGMLNHLFCILEEILTHPSRYSDPYLQQASIVTLMRFMTVSSTCCSEKIGFVMNILRRTNSSTMKKNIIVGLSDFTCRFPNVIEPWTSTLYGTLLERDVQVRLTAVKTISYLILQEMIRVRGQLSDLATCIVDENVEIQSATKEFFREIAHKQNILYNVLPDVISRLSSNDSPIEEEKFRIIMKHVMGLIQKDRLIETLLEKLCSRFRITNLERQWRDIAYCLSLLNHTERSLKKLIEFIPHYKDKIQFDEVYDCFKSIISNANKQINKPELKNVAKELETKLQECLTVQENGEASQNENQSDAEPAPSQPQLKKRPAVGKKPQSKAAKKRNKNRLSDRMQSSGSESEDDDDDENSPPARPTARAPAKRATQKGGRSKKKQVSSGSSAESSDNEPQPVRGRRRR